MLWGKRIYRSDPKLNDNKYDLTGVSDKKKTTFFKKKFKAVLFI